MAKSKEPQEVDDRTMAQIQADQEATDFLGEEVKNGQVVNVPEEVINPPTEEPAPEPEPTPEPEPVPVPPVIDPEKLKAELRAEVSEEIVNKLKPQEPQESLEDIPPWEREGRQPKDWKEVAQFSKEQAMKELNAAIEEENRQQQEAARLQQESEAARFQAVNAQWDEEFDALRAAGKLPAIENKDDNTDPGRKAQIGLLQQMLETNNQRIAQGKPAIMSVAAFHNLYYKDVTAQPPGADAPVSLSRKAVSQPEPGQYSYHDIHNTPWEAFETPKR